MADDCKGRTVQFTAASTRYGTRWYDPDNIDDKSRAIAELLRPMGVARPCDGECKEDFHGCLPVSVTIAIPEGKGRFKRVRDGEGEDELETYLLRVEQGATITIRTKCRCLPTNPD